MKKYNTFYLPLVIIAVSMWWLITSSSTWGGWIFPIIPFITGVVLLVIRLVKFSKLKEQSQGSRIAGIVIATISLCILGAIFLTYLVAAGMIPWVN